MTPDELLRLLLQDEYLVLDIPLEEFTELEKHIGVRAYTYWPAIGQLRIKMATQMHATVSHWAMNLITAGTEAGAFDKNKLYLLPEARLSGFKGEYQDRIKVPDVALVPCGCLWPTVVFEFGYTEPYEDLKADVKLLLEGSEGQIGKAIIIKLQPLQDGETQIQKGFVEMWHLKNGQAWKDGGRKNLFPPPGSHATQKLEVTLADLLRDKVGNLINEGCTEDDTLDLELDPLSEAINEATWRHLIMKGVLEQE
ncbi:hypothetical protein L873DRAFT_1729311 [Choiromyces venosus 120613-1]|uniref:Restriction endonuclease domain-containing protein n=1 Tax=Choiromyces venosus 120613-1 TaxID=1336337 RepID=A0A3N4K5D1_9PEZI|nr:hypothetical protein L873DRAFT_1729311 [Choiromyces venosus 120613-1]